MRGLAEPGDVLAYWIGPAADDPGAAETRNKVWFRKSGRLDAAIAEKFTPTLAALAAGLAEDWAERGPRGRLAAVIVLDQFSRHIHRGRPGAFENDALALRLVKEGLVTDADTPLSEMGRMFFYLPLEHSERAMDQALCVSLFERLLKEAREGFGPIVGHALDYARRHKEVIDRFGRFPHRNAVLSRDTTPEEAAFLERPGSRF